MFRPGKPLRQIPHVLSLTKSAVAEGIGRLQQNRASAGVIVVAILLAHFSGVRALNPPSLFGLSQDDSLYFSSAKALAEGRGYVLPSLPGSPAATKYPILYPWLLSWVWRINPDFPANLSWAAALTYFFAVAAILLCYLFCRNSLQLPRLQALGVTAFFALHPTFIFYSARLMTDVPFAALALCFLLLASRAAEPETSVKWAVWAGLAASLCIFLRLAGVAFVGGAVVALLLAKLWRKMFVLVASCSPGISYFLYQSWFHVSSPPPVPFSPNLPGWQQMWSYYTSYTVFRHLDSPDLHSTLTLLLNQALYLVSAISAYFISPLSERNLVFWFVCTAVSLMLFLLAALRHFAARQRSTVITVFFAYLLLLLGWDYVEWERFLLPFLPEITALIVYEAYSCWSYFRGYRSGGLAKALYAVVTLGLIGLGGMAGWNYAVEDRYSHAEARFQRESAMPEKLGAYAWLRANTSPQDVSIASEDGLAFLYSGRQYINFAVLMPFDLYDRPRLERDLDHMPDVALAVHARYWVITSSDSQTQLHAFEVALRERLAYWETVLPRVYISPGGTIRIYDLQSWQRSESSVSANFVGSAGSRSRDLDVSIRLKPAAVTPWLPVQQATWLDPSPGYNRSQ
jgi:hypothetical protein